MEGEKDTAEEKEEEEELRHHITAASSVDDLALPIMQWEDLSQRIAQLERQEQEWRERSKVSREEACGKGSLKTAFPVSLSWPPKSVFPLTTHSYFHSIIGFI